MLIDYERLLLFFLNRVFVYRHIYEVIYLIAFSFVYFTDGYWDSMNARRMLVATDVSPISKMMLIKGNLWCSTLNSIVIIDTASLEVKVFPHIVILNYIHILEC